MSRSRVLMGLFALLACFTFSFGTALADKGGPGAKDKPHGQQTVKARITWSTARVEQSLAAGETATVTVMLTSSADLENVTMRVNGGLGRVLTIEPASFASLKAGVATPVKLTFTMPAEHAHSQGGVIQLRSGKRVIPAHLSVKITVPGSTDDD